MKPRFGGADHKLSTPSWMHAIPSIAILLILVCLRVQLIAKPLPLNDFMTYWAAGRLFLSGSNPYSATAMYAIERSLGWQHPQPLVLLNPPWALPFTALIAALPFSVAHRLWWVVTLFTEAICSVALWRYFGGETRKQWMAVVLALTFLPAGTAELMGQITPLMLAGLTAFLLSLRWRREGIAGVCLIAVGMKPHLLVPVFLAIILWTIQSRRWKLAVAAVSTYALASLGAILFNHNVLGYFRDTPQAALDTSCGVGGVLRSLFGMQLVWLQFLPTMIGAVWFAFDWKKHRKAWSWEERIPLLLLVSIATAPYAWAHDYILALPAFVALTVALSKTRTDWLIPSGLYLVVQMVISIGVTKAWLATLSLLWLVLYCAVTRYFTSPPVRMEAALSQPVPAT